MNLGVRTIKSHPRAFLQMFNIWLLVAFGPPVPPIIPIAFKGFGIHPLAFLTAVGRGALSCMKLLPRPVGGG